MFENIVITGITDFDSYPPCKHKKYWKQCIDDQLLCVPEQKPDIESINEVKVNICVDNFEIINTVLGKKLIVYGTKHIKILYTANNCQQSLHSAHWSVPFCDFILLGDLCDTKDGVHVDRVFIGVENVFVKCFDSRLVDLSILFIICPEIDVKRNGSLPKNNPDTCKTQYHICNGKSYTNLYSY